MNKLLKTIKSFINSLGSYSQTTTYYNTERVKSDDPKIKEFTKQWNKFMEDMKL